MAKVVYSKWKLGTKPGDSLENIIDWSIHYRISAVRYYFRLAAERHSESLEHVHRLRTWTMRSVAALHLYHKHLPYKPASKLTKQLKKLRKAAGNARDYDVQIKKYEAEKTSKENLQLLKFLEEERQLSQAPLDKIYRNLDKGKILSEQFNQIRQFMQLSKFSLTQEKTWDFESLAKARLQLLLKEYFDSAPTYINDLNDLHKFRLHGKKLRYSMELTATAFPREFRKELYQEITKLQEKLGTINDSAVLLRRLQYWTISLADKELISIFERLYEREEAHLKIALDNFKVWWCIEYIQSLQLRFDDMISDSYRQAVA